MTESVGFLTCQVCGKPVHEVEGHFIHNQPYDPWEPPIHSAKIELERQYRYGT